MIFKTFHQGFTTQQQSLRTNHHRTDCELNVQWCQQIWYGKITDRRKSFIHILKPITLYRPFVSTPLKIRKTSVNLEFFWKMNIVKIHFLLIIYVCDYMVFFLSSWSTEQNTCTNIYYHCLRWYISPHYIFWLCIIFFLHYIRLWCLSTTSG